MATLQIEVLGPGCPNCARLLAEVEKAIAEARVGASINKVEDEDAIARYGVRRTPALVIGGRVVASGIVLDASDILPFLTSA